MVSSRSKRWMYSPNYYYSVERRSTESVSINLRTRLINVTYSQTTHQKVYLSLTNEKPRNNYFSIPNPNIDRSKFFNYCFILLLMIFKKHVTINNLKNTVMKTYKNYATYVYNPRRMDTIRVVEIFYSFVRIFRC